MDIEDSGSNMIIDYTVNMETEDRRSNTRTLLIWKMRTEDPT
jgi:hypothetical protein